MLIVSVSLYSMSHTKEALKWSDEEKDLLELEKIIKMIENIIFFFKNVNQHNKSLLINLPNVLDKNSKIYCFS